MAKLVTGVGGFIGGAIARRLIDEGENVIGIDSLTDYYDPEIKKRNVANLQASNFKFLEMDLNTAPLEEVLQDTDVVFHQAGQPGVRKSWGKDFNTYVASNINATQRLLEASLATDLKRFVYASSSSIYGNAQTYPTYETVVPKPVSPYGVSKLAAEHLCALYAANFGLKTTSLRYFTVYGPRQRPDMAFTRFLRAAVTGQAIEVYGSGEQIRDFTYVDDIVEANFLAAATNETPGAVFNVAGGTSISVNEVLALIETISGEKLNIRRIAKVAGDVNRTGGSTEYARSGLGWNPTVGIEEGLQLQLQWAQEEFSTYGHLGSDFLG